MAEPELITTADQMGSWVRQRQLAGKRVGFVPTMGCLHAGHLSLARQAAERCDDVVVSIFVNPTQFGPHEDFQRYPRQLAADIEMLKPLGVGAVFAPTTDVMYPAGHSTFVEPPKVSVRWEGERRPGHFRGVATIVLKLFHLVPAQLSVFGQKDYQQALVIQHMVRDLNVPMELLLAETTREPDGLAMSSRNRYLSSSDRQRALGLWRALQEAQRLFTAGATRAATLEQAMSSILAQHVDRTDYVAIVDPQSLEPVEEVQAGTRLLVAAHLGTTRLIDNIELVSGPTGKDAPTAS